jgi:hypothetical protein
MARRKTLPESVRTKQTLAERLSALRAELFGDRGGPELARRLGLPIRTWYNYEAGVTVPAEVILKIIELTSVEPMWLLHGRGPKYRRPIHEARHDTVTGGAPSVESLLRTALELLERGEVEPPRVGGRLPKGTPGAGGGESAGNSYDAALGTDESAHGPAAKTSGGRYVASRNEWLDAQRENRCIRVTDDAMAPIVADGAYLAFAKADERLADLDGKIVVAWLDNEPVVRWFHHHGRFALLRAENTKTEPSEILIDMDEPNPRRRFRRVLWINTPH